MSLLCFCSLNEDGIFSIREILAIEKLSKIIMFVEDTTFTLIMNFRFSVWTVCVKKMYLWMS